MSDLKDCLTESGFSGVRTYIQSGNVIFRSESSDSVLLSKSISSVIQKTFNLSVIVVAFSDTEWKNIIQSVPEWWGKDETWKHNLLILTEPYDIDEATRQIGPLKPEIESLKFGEHVIYQSVSWQHFGHARRGKLANLSIYKKMTVRNYNTATKILALLP